MISPALSREPQEPCCGSVARILRYDHYFVSVSYLSNQIRTIISLQDPLFGPAMFFPKSACQKVNCQKLNCHKLNCQKLNCQKARLSEGIFIFSAMSLYAQTGRNSSRAAPLLFGIMHTPPSCFCPELLWTCTFLRLAVYPPNMHFCDCLCL